MSIMSLTLPDISVQLNDSDRLKIRNLEFQSLLAGLFHPLVTIEASRPLTTPPTLLFALHLHRPTPHSRLQSCNQNHYRSLLENASPSRISTFPTLLPLSSVPRRSPPLESRRLDHACMRK